LVVVGVTVRLLDRLRLRVFATILVLMLSSNHTFRFELDGFIYHLNATLKWIKIYIGRKLHAFGA